MHSHDFAADIATPLATLSVDGEDVPIYAQGGGTPFYAETYYARSLSSSADIPENLKCICKIATDVPIEQGSHAGISARDWLVAHAKYAARFFREHGLEGKPIVLRPFHEHTGAWFWWGQPYWSCGALLGDDQAVSGPDAYRAAYRTFAEAVRGEPGMENVIFADLEDMRSMASAVAAIGEAKGKPHALTETRTYRLHLLHRVSKLAAGDSLALYSADHVSRWYDTTPRRRASAASQRTPRSASTRRPASSPSRGDARSPRHGRARDSHVPARSDANTASSSVGRVNTMMHRRR
ncbi:hypothetical protein BE11_20415 [Sorangium cellulosum]|nr:hypothetical protein BE11_20415 [Sorangium cellulosum]